MVSRNRFELLRWMLLLGVFAGSCAAQPAPVGKSRLAEALQLHADGRFADAGTVFTELMRDVERSKPDSSFLGQVVDCLAVNEQAMGHYLQAESLLKRALTIAKKTGDNSREADVMTHQAELYMEQRRYADAEPILRQILQSGNGTMQILTLDDLAVISLWKHKYSEAEQLFRKAIGQIETELGPEDPMLTGSLFPLALMIASQRRASEAVDLADRAWQIVQTALPKVGAADMASSLSAMGVVYLRAGRLSQAQSFAQRALEIAENVYGPEHRRLATYLMGYAAVLRQVGNSREAKSLDKRAQTILAQSVRDNPPLAVTVNSLR
jgi:tetratricopeptide (TPR) repeat protein